jgi:adenylate cyclase
MNRYMTAMTKRIIDNNGTLDKYIGDAQMAFWNAPLDDPDHAKNAVRTALDMLKDLEAFNAEIKDEGIPAFGMGLGINTATVVVGNMGSDQRFDYTCLGDGVNLAARLEGQSKPYGVKLVTGPVTAELVRDVYQTIELDLIAVKGKTEPARIFTIFEEKMPSFEQDHMQFLDAYRAGKWLVAEHIANKLKDSSPMPAYYEMMYQRIQDLKFEEPLNWDGVYRATSK